MNDSDDSIWSWDVAADVLPDLISGFLHATLVVTLLGSAIAAVLGLVIAVLRRSLPQPFKAILGFLVNFVRMTPIVVQLLFAYSFFLQFDPLTIGVVIFGIHYATYMAEVYRAGIENVPTGQWEATTALSMSRRRTWIAVIVPQALRATIPALGNYVISMFKDTPFLLSISVVELVKAATTYGGDHFTYIEAITMAGVIFLVASYPTSLLIGRLEKRLAFAS